MPAFVQALDRLIRLAAVLLLLALLGCVVIGVVTRLFNRPVTWSEEMAQHLLVWTGFVGLMLASRRRSHIRITVFLDKLPRIARLGAELVIQAGVILFAACLLWYGTPLIPRNWDIEWVSLALPAGLLYLPIPFAALLLIGQAIADAALALAGRTPAEAEPGAQPL
jgi:TRAP-type C4-dicarboxylate transport system permease small subunit